MTCIWQDAEQSKQVIVHNDMVSVLGELWVRITSHRCSDLAVWRHARDHPLLTRGPCVPWQVPVLIPGGRGQRGHEELCPCGWGLDGRVERLFLWDEPRYLLLCPYPLCPRPWRPSHPPPDLTSSLVVTLREISLTRHADLVWHSPLTLSFRTYIRRHPLYSVCSSRYSLSPCSTNFVYKFY